MLAAVSFAARRLMIGLAILGLVGWAAAPAPTVAAEIVAGAIHPMDRDYSESSSYGPMAETLRRLAEERLAWVAPGCLKNPTVQVKILAINDFHGQITAGKKVSGRPVGSAPVLASYLAEAQKAGRAAPSLPRTATLWAPPPRSRPCSRTSPACPFLTCWETAP